MISGGMPICFAGCLGSIYEDLKGTEASIDLNGLIGQLFTSAIARRRPGHTKGIGRLLDDLIYKQDHEPLQRVRIVRFYDNNTVLIVKPDHDEGTGIRSTAIRDADETLWDLTRQRY